MSVKNLYVYLEVDDYESPHCEEVHDEDGTCLFSVWNLTDCPEDAVLGRALFSAEDWLDAVRYGMELAKQGYDSIEVTTMCVSE